MVDVKSEISRAFEAHGHLIDEVRQKLVAIEGCDKQRLEHAVEKLKAAHKAFHDDALGCVGF